MQRKLRLIDDLIEIPSVEVIKNRSIHGRGMYTYHDDSDHVDADIEESHEESKTYQGISGNLMDVYELGSCLGKK